MLNGVAAAPVTRRHGGGSGSETERATDRSVGKDENEPLTSREKALIAIEAALDKKALEPVLLDVSEQNSYTDFILVLSGSSDRHVQSIAEGIEETFGLTLGWRPIGSEGKNEGRWVLLDYGELVIHVFYHPLRDFYDLEGLWCDAPRIPVEVPAEARAAASMIY